MKKPNEIEGQPVLALREKLEARVAEDLVFLPSPSQRAAKARFWKRADFFDGKDLTAADAARLSGVPSVRGWWTREGFKDWFLNKEEASERLEYLYMLWMDKAEDLLLDPMANHNAIVQLGKVIAQLGGRFSKYDEPQQDSIGKMNPEQLRAYIERLAPKFLKATEGIKASAPVEPTLPVSESKSEGEE